MSLSEPTLGEIVRRLDDLAKDVKDIPLRIQEDFVRKDVYEAQHNHTIDRVKRLESRHEWVVRTIGALILAALASYFSMK